MSQKPQLCLRIRKQQHPRPAHSSEGSKNLPKWWSPRRGYGAVLAASKPLQVYPSIISVTLLIVDLLQFYVYCIRSGVTQCARLMMLYLDRMCQCGLHAVPWSHICIFMHHPLQNFAVPQDFCSTLKCPFGTILLTPYSMVWDWRVSRPGPLLFHRPKLLYPYYILLLFFTLSSSCL